jgi:endonuclease/exonuclease/phosphatase family metal-dependent hydrolase
VPLLVRSWNVFHGNTDPPQRRAFLRQMVELATADDPDVLCLQELPAWALAHLASWTGMQVVADVAQPPRFGPLPWTAELGRAVTSVHHGLFRSAVAGQGNAILLASGIRLLERRTLVLNARSFRAAQAEWLRLPLLPRLAWAKERRVCQAVRVELPDRRVGVVANLHTTAYHADQRLADAELLRAAVFADGLAESAHVCVVAGDFNVEAHRSSTQTELTTWGFSGGGSGIDQVRVRGARASAVERWADDRRRLDGRLLSDHAPVEVRVE